MASQSFSKKEALSLGWRRLKDEFWPLISITAVVILASLIFSFASEAISGTLAIEILLGLLGWVVQIFLALGLYRIVLNVVRGGHADMKDLLSEKEKFLPYLGAMVLTGIIVVLGLILFIVPGIIFAIMFLFYPFVIVDTDAGPIDAMRESADITKGSRWNLFWLLALLAIINLIGALLFGVGLLVTIPFSMMVAAYVYDRLRDNLTPVKAEDHHPQRVEV